jgi:DNA-binding helix-hairpin-helix protein with protein kinase domain
MVNYRDTQGNNISLTKEINRSGEGVIWQTNRKGCLAKIYHQSTSQKIQKLQLMIANPPDDPTRGQGHVSIAWPIDLLKDNRGNYVGFLMPEIKNAVELLEVYNSKYRNQKFPQFNWYCLHITALNVALIIKALHSKDYIIGDMKTQNFLVNGLGQVSIVDTDSFQVKDLKTNQVYRCPVGSEGFTPPELIGKDLSTLTQTRYSDRFRLGVIIYLLLFTHHPFMGVWKGNGDPPGQDESISKGFWPYGINSLLQPSLNTVALDIVHPELKKCFLKCFNDGHQSPTSRPSPEDWSNALTIAINNLVVCSRINNHIYAQSHASCYWCDRTARRKVDIFPSVQKPILPPSALTKKSVIVQPKPTIVTPPPVSISSPSPNRIKPYSKPKIAFIILGIMITIIILFIIF